MIDDGYIATFTKLLNSFETGKPSTDFRSVFIYRDGNGGRKQLTLGRGYTSDGGNLQKVISRYISLGGHDASYMKTKVHLSTPEMVADKDFQKRLGAAGDEKIMQDAQDAVFQEEYMRPALNWAVKYGFSLPLSVAVIVDSFLHSGSMLQFLLNKFPEKKPSGGGSEKLWIASYLQTRLSWLQGKTGILRSTVYRPKFFIAEIAKGNWDFKCPLTANGVKVC